MAYLPNNPNGVNVAPSENTKPQDGFWGERRVTWLKITGTYTYAGVNQTNAFNKPWSKTGWTSQIIKVIEDRGTLLGVYNDQPSPLGAGPATGTGTGGTLYVALGYAAGFFLPDSTVTGTMVTPGVTPVTFTGSVPDPADPANATLPIIDPVLAEIIGNVLGGFGLPAELTITVGNGFAVL